MCFSCENTSHQLLSNTCWLYFNSEASLICCTAIVGLRLFFSGEDTPRPLLSDTRWHSDLYCEGTPRSTQPRMCSSGEVNLDHCTAIHAGTSSAGSALVAGYLRRWVSLLLFCCYTARVCLAVLSIGCVSGARIHLDPCSAIHAGTA